MKLLVHCAAIPLLAFAAAAALAQDPASPPPDPGLASAVQTAVGRMADFLLSYAIALAAVGTLTMALIEAWKTLFRTRDRFHQRALREFLECTAGGDSGPYVELMHLATGIGLDEALDVRAASRGRVARSYRNALFTMDLERMMSPVQDAADTALTYPNQYRRLFDFLVRGAEPGDVRFWLDHADQRGAHLDEHRRQAAMEAYSRLGKYVRRRLDGFQLATAFRWRERNQLAAYLLGFVILFLSFELGGEVNVQLQQWSLAQVVLASLLGGMVAPVAKDLVVALRRVRGG